MTRRERIIVLLENYRDVEEGLQDPAFRTDGYVPRMCRAWNHPSYVELRRVVGALQSESPPLFWHLAETYFRYEKRRVAYCPRCTAIYPAARIDDIHRHGQSSVTLVSHMIHSHLPTKKARVDEAIDWLSESFVGEPFVPDDLLAMVA